MLYETGRCSGAFKIQYDNKKCNRRPRNWARRQSRSSKCPFVKLPGCTPSPFVRLPGSHSKPTGLHYLPGCAPLSTGSQAPSQLLWPPQTVPESHPHRDALQSNRYRSELPFHPDSRSAPPAQMPFRAHPNRSYDS